MTWIALGLTTYLITAALGTSAQLGLVNTRPFRWAHHLLFACVWVTLGLLIVNSLGKPWLWTVALVVLCMAILPRFKAGTRPHCTLATLGLAGYLVTFIWAFSLT